MLLNVALVIFYFTLIVREPIPAIIEKEAKPIVKEKDRRHYYPVLFPESAIVEKKGTFRAKVAMMIKLSYHKENQAYINGQRIEIDTATGVGTFSIPTTGSGMQELEIAYSIIGEKRDSVQQDPVQDTLYYKYWVVK